MPYHKITVVYEVDVWVPRHCTCGTGDRCNCDNFGYWNTEQRTAIHCLWFDYGPITETKPPYSRGYPVPDKVPRAA